MKCPKCQSENSDTARFCSNCATALTAADEAKPAFTKTLMTPVEDLPRRTLFANRYEIIEELGKGGMGRVYRALDNEIHEDVAIKLLKPEIASDEKIIERFRNELKIARKISHKNVCRTYHISKEEGTPYITMEYVRGEDLKSLAEKRGVMPGEEAVGIAKQVCEGLVEAHKLGVVHRDLKPQNIMTDENGNIKIMDFGIARSIEAPGVTQTGVMIGTPDYMSPEQAEGEETDQRTDIYALGVILYEMVTGRVPFKGDTALSVALKHKSQLPMDPRKLNPDVSGDLARLILICMEKDKERRYQTAGAILNDLQNIEEGLPLGTKIRPRRETFIAPLIRKKLFIPAMVVVLAMIAILIWQGILKNTGPSLPALDRPSVAIMYFKNNTGDQSLDFLSDAFRALLTYDLMQSKYLYVLPNDRLIQIMNRLDAQGKGDYSRDVLENVADWGVVDHIIQGSYFKFGDDFRINIQIQIAGSWDIIGSETLTGKLDLYAMIDELTPKIKSFLNITEEDITSDIDFNIGHITTLSPEAFAIFNEGLKHWAIRDSTRAIEFLNKSVDIDPQFALAHSFLAWIYHTRLMYAEAQAHREKALSQAEHLADRERSFVEAILSTELEAVASLKKILKLYPEDWMANYLLGEVYLRIEEWAKARDLFLENKRNKVDFASNYSKLAEAYKSAGLFDKSIETYRYYLENYPDRPGIRYNLARVYLCKGQLDKALDEVENGLSLFPSEGQLIWLRGAIHLYNEVWSEAEEGFLWLIREGPRYGPLIGRESLGHMFQIRGELKKSIELYSQGLEEARTLKYIDYEFYFNKDLGSIYLQLGNLDDALSAFNAVLNVSTSPLRQVKSHLLKGMTLLRKDSINEAHNEADAIKIIVDEGMSEKLIRYYYLLMGMIEFHKDNYKEAEKYQKQALDLLPSMGEIPFWYDDHALFYQAIAMTYLKLKDFDKAQEQFEQIVSLTEGRFSFGIIYAKSYYMLGKIFEQKSWEGKAVEQYEKFLDLWKDADPRLPEVEDARERLLGLEKQNRDNLSLKMGKE